jgi:CRISPR type III-A-associated protein Csm2
MNDNDYARWVKEGIDSEMVKKTKELAEDLAKSDEKRPNFKAKKAMTTGQLRKFFGEIKRIQAARFSKETVDSVIMLKPKLAYAVGRDNNETKIEDFYKVMTYALDAIDYKDIIQGERHFNNFIKIFESIVAYHKAATVAEELKKKRTY